MRIVYPVVVQVNGHYHCSICAKEYDRETNACPECLQKITDKLDRANNRAMKKTHFDMCDQEKEVALTLKNLEASGKLNTPQLKRWAKDKMEEAKHYPKIDYQVHGHPNFDKDFKHPAFTIRDDEE